MADFENILPPPGIEPGIPNSFEGSDMVFVEGVNPLPPNTPLVPYNEDVSIPSVPTGGFLVNYDQNNPFDIPPSICMVVPVIPAARLEHKNDTRSPNSFGS